MAKTKWQAAFARLCSYCKKHNEVAQTENETARQNSVDNARDREV